MSELGTSLDTRCSLHPKQSPGNTSLDLRPSRPSLPAQPKSPLSLHSCRQRASSARLAFLELKGLLWAQNLAALGMRAGAGRAEKVAACTPCSALLPPACHVVPRGLCVQDEPGGSRYRAESAR